MSGEQHCRRHGFTHAPTFCSEKKAKLLVLILLGIPTLWVAAVFLVSRLTTSGLDATYREITRAEFECPKGSTEGIERWGNAGYMRFCKQGGIMHGPWMAWEAQRLNIQGEYREGKQHGLWTFWNSDGSKYKIIEYRNGFEIREEVLTGGQRRRTN